MPITWQTVTRRQFLTHSATLVGTLALASKGRAADSAHETIALLSDTHIAADLKMERSGVVMADNFAAVTKQVLAHPDKPNRLLINGDCALLKGEPGDYHTLLSLLEPLEQANISLTLGLGNHDDRDAFLAAFQKQKLPASEVENKRATILDTNHVRWFVLDSLNIVNDTPGALGEAQISWLDANLKKHSDKPAFVLVHHNINTADLLPKAEVVVNVAKNRIPVAGLTDSTRVMELLHAHKHLSAFFCGHTHQWNVLRWEGISFVNLPCVAYPFTPNDPNGWVACRHASAQSEIELFALNDKHPAHHQKVALPYRGA